MINRGDLMEEKVTLAVSGKFHAFHLASEFARMGKLSSLYAVHRTVKPPQNLSTEQYRNRFDLALGVFLSSHFPFLKMTQLKKNRVFEKWLINDLKNAKPGIIHSWNGNSFDLFRDLKSPDWLKCLERSCPHNMFQHEIISAEADFLNIEYFKDRASLEREIEELYLADVIVAPSQYSANSYNDSDLIKKIRVNPLGANFKYRDRKEKKSSLVVLMVGNSFLRKGTHYLIEAFKMIDRIDAELWIRGDIPDSYLKLITDKRIKIIPPVLPERLQEIYESADIFVQPSIDEGFGMTVLEALSYGLPLVVTENVGAKDLLTSEVSITVPIRNPEALARAINLASEMPSMEFDEARRKILENASWSKCAQRMLESVYVR